MNYAVLFPGQGSQHVGMGADLFAARPDLLGDAAAEILGWSPATVCAAGPEEEITRTERAQPLLYALAYALWEEFRHAVGRPPAAAAGHSLGEYTALAAAGSYDYFTGLRLVRARAEAMAAAAARRPSGMAALLGVDPDGAEQIAAARREDGGSLWVANINAPGQVAVAGAAADVEWLGDNASTLGVRRVVALKVAGAFHTPLMEPAVEPLASALASIDFAAPRFPIFGNATAAPLGDPGAALAQQLVAPVRFAESLTAMAADGVDVFVHVGPGDVTAGMARRTVPGATVVTVSEPADIDEAVAALGVSVQ